MPLLIEHVRRILKLEPFDAFAAKVRAANAERLAGSGIGGPYASAKEIETRGTGRTTKMICDAIAMASAGRPAYLEADTMQITMIHVEWARRLASEIGVDPSLIRPHDGFTALPPGAAHLVDHREIERREMHYREKVPSKPAPAGAPR